MNKVDLIVFHSPCFDGAAGCWAVEKYCKEMGFPPPERFGCKPGMEKYDFPDMKGKSVIVVDICFDRETILKMKEECKELVVLDHHKTAKENMEGLEFAHFDMNKSGCQLAWDYFFHGTERPLFLDLIGDRDLWNWKLEYSKEFNNAIFNKYGSLGQDETMQAMWTLSEYKDSEYKREFEYGRLCEEFQQKQIDLACKHALKRKLVTPEGKTYTVWTSDSRLHRSEIGHELAKREDGDFALIYSYELKNNEWWISLRSISAEKADLTVIAKSFPRGGGHPCAAGFTWKGNIQELLLPIE